MQKNCIYTYILNFNFYLLKNHNKYTKKKKNLLFVFYLLKTTPKKIIK
jgi:hypothetical protein